MLSELERRAWDARTKANEHKPEMALKVALDDIASGKFQPVSVAVVIVTRDDEFENVTFMHAGSLTDLALEGALGRCVRYIQDE